MTCKENHLFFNFFPITMDKKNINTIHQHLSLVFIECMHLRYFQSSLSNKSTNPRISLSYLQAFKQYPDDVLRQSFSGLKDSGIITCSQYHKESLQILLSTSHIIQSKTYDYGPKYVLYCNPKKN